MKKHIYSTIVTMMAFLVLAPVSWANQHQRENFSSGNSFSNRSSVAIVAEIKGRVFRSSARSINGVLRQCLKWYQSGSLNNVVNIYVSVNSGYRSHLRNNFNYWKTQSEVCTQITSHLIDRGYFDPKETRELLVVGNMNNREFVFSGPNKSSIYSTCENFYNTQIGSNVGDIYTSYNGQPLTTKSNSRSYWRDSYSVCTKITEDIPKYLNYRNGIYGNRGRNSSPSRPPEKGANRKRAKLNCLEHANGEKWFERSGIIQKELQCLNKNKRGKIVVDYARRIEFTCRNGKPIATGKEVKGRELKKVNMCRLAAQKFNESCYSGEKFKMTGFSVAERDRDHVCWVIAPQGDHGDTIRLDSLTGQGLISLTCENGKWSISKTVTSWCNPTPEN